MDDEFEVNVEDGSGEEVAARIVGLRKLCVRGDFEVVDGMLERWRERQARGGERVAFQRMHEGDEDDEDSDDEDDEEVEDVEMDDAPELVKAPKEKIVPKVDEEGFTEVVGKRRR